MYNVCSYNQSLTKPVSRVRTVYGFDFNSVIIKTKSFTKIYYYVCLVKFIFLNSNLLYRYTFCYGTFMFDL